MTETLNPKTHTDIKRLVWIERFLPAGLRPYAYLARLDRPVGVWLLLLPGWWAITLASYGFKNMGAHEWFIFVLFGIGAIIMRAAGCVINDLWDRDLDKLVERTRQRPLAAGTISAKQGFLFLATLLLFGLLILLQFNRITIVLGFLAIPLIVSYPLMKRITWWPQAFLGLTFNFSVLMGWGAVTGELWIFPFVLYLAAIFWTLGYDTIYAHQDKDDDSMAGIKSTAQRFGKWSKFWVAGFYAFSFYLIFWLYNVWEGGTGGVYALSKLMIILGGIHLCWQVKTWRPDDPASSLKIFKSNRDFGLLILAAFAFGGPV